MSAELRSVLEGAGPLRRDAGIWYVIVLLPLETSRLLEHVLALRDALPPDDPRNALREQCMAAVTEAIRRANGT